MTRLLPLVAVGGALALLVFAAADQMPFLDRVRLHDRLSAGSVRNFVTVYRHSVLTQTLYPLPSDRLNDLYHLAIAPLVVVGAIQVVRRAAPSVIWFLVASYGTMLFLAPVRDGRYLWPLTPILAWWLVAGIRAVIGRAIRSAPPSRVVFWQAGVVATLCIGAAAVQAAAPRQKEFIKDLHTVEVFDLLRGLHDDDAVRVLFINPRVLTLETGIPAMGVPAGNDQRVLNEIDTKRLTHLVLRVHSDLPQHERRLLQLVEKCQDSFPEILRNGSYTVRAVAVAPPCAPPVSPVGQ